MAEDNSTQDATENNQSYYPSVSFYFSVVIDGEKSSFQETSGLSVKLGLEETVAGGENQFSHRLSPPPKYDNLILKRGMASPNLVEWCEQSLSKFLFTPKDISVNLLDMEGAALVGWVFHEAYPVALKIADLRSEDGFINVETVEIAYNNFERIKLSH